jgi:ATP-dependent DNA ligase
MALDVSLDQPPMEATPVDEIPRGAEWQYEPKWDGFRCLAFRNGDKVFLQSKSGQPLARYFPEVDPALREFVFDGEIVIPIAGRLSFDELLRRVHPAASRVRKLAAEHPAMLVVHRVHRRLDQQVFAKELSQLVRSRGTAIAGEIRVMSLPRGTKPWP